LEEITSAGAEGAQLDKQQALYNQLLPILFSVTQIVEMCYKNSS